MHRDKQRPRHTRKLEFIRVALVGSDDVMDGHGGVGLEPKDHFWSEAAVFGQSSGKNMTVGLQALVLELEDGGLGAYGCMGAVLGIGLGLRNGVAVDFDCERGWERVHCFCWENVQGEQNQAEYTKSPG